MIPLDRPVPEETFNHALGAALRKTTVRWRGHRGAVAVGRAGSVRDRPDILIRDSWSPPLAIECSFQRSDAQRDAAHRLGLVVSQGWPIRTALAVHAPSMFRRLSLDAMTEALRAGAEIRYAIYQAAENRAAPRRWPADGFIAGDVYALAALVPAAAVHKEDIQAVAKVVAGRLVSAAALLAERLPAHLQEALVRQVHQRAPLTGLRTLMVLWLDALLMQSGTGISRAPAEQERAWHEMLARGQGLVFQPAVAALGAARASHVLATGMALEQIDSAREQIELANLGTHINVGAELLPILSEDRKEAAAYYTQPATAELLAHLTIVYEQLEASEWGDARLFSRRRLADLTCGTGTLLRSGYRRILSFHERAGGTTESSQALHRVAMEQGLAGADVSPIAAHLTASSLAALGMGEPYGASQIGWVDVGGDLGRTGSLEYFDADNVTDLFGTAGGVSAGSHTNGSSIVEVPDYAFDWILMNPPYSRTRGGQSAFDIAGLTEKERKACQKRWAMLVRSEPCSNQAGMAASFLALARRKVKTGGRIGFVLPLTAALADSWTVTRQMVEHDFEDIVAVAVVAGGALGKDALSADTHMEEMLLTGTRTRRRGRQGGAIHCVTLYHPPTRMGEAGEIARAISAARKACNGARMSIRVGHDEIGQLCVLRTDGTGAPWSPVGTLHPDLVRAAMDLGRGILAFDNYHAVLDLPMTTVGELFTVGPTHHRIGHTAGSGFKCGAFEMHPVRGVMDATGQDRALWAASSKAQKALIVTPTHKGVAPRGVGTGPLRQEMRRLCSTLFYAKNMRWTSQTLLAATTGHAALGGNAWVSLRHSDDRVQKAFALWANSIVGMLVHWTRGQRTQTGRSLTKIKAVKQIPCSHLDQLPNDRLSHAAAAFDRLKSRALLPACQAHADKTRKEIDAAVTAMLGLEDAAHTIEALRTLWCHEPSVHGHNRKAVQLLPPEGRSL